MLTTSRRSRVLGEVMAFEWRYQTRQISFAAASLLFAGFGFMLTATRFGPDNVHLNSPYSIAESLGLLSMAAVFILAVFCAGAVVRDREHRMESLLFTTSIGKREYLLGRFGGSFLAAFTAFSAAAGGMMIAAAMPWHDATQVGPISPWPYLWALFVLVLPGMLAAAVILFGIATLTRSMLASVVGAVAIYVLYFVAAGLTNSPLMAASRPGATTLAAASLLDPFGLSAFFEQTQFWTPAVRDVRLLALRGNFLINRLFWLAFAAAAWLVIDRRFAFRVTADSKRVLNDDAELPYASPASPSATLSAGQAAGWAAFVALTKLELRAFLRSVPFLLLNLLWAGLAAAEILTDTSGGEHGSALEPATGFILMTLQRPLTLVATVLILYYSAEIVWRERTVGVADLLHATPAPNAAFVMSKWIALAVLSATLVASSTLVAVIIQLLKGATSVDAVALFGFGWFFAAPLAVFAMAAVGIQALSPHKYFGMLLVLLLAVVGQAGGMLGLEHPLLRLGAMPPVEYSKMNGFGAYVTPFLWFTLLWAAAGALLLLATVAIWRRAGSDRAQGILRTIRSRSTPSGRALAILLILLIIGTASFVAWNTNALNAWASSSARLDWRADYEKRYGALATQPQPRVSGIRAEIALDPTHRSARARGTIQLVNDTAVAIDEVIVSVRRDVQVGSLIVTSARLARTDERFAVRWFRLERPLPPRGRLALHFDLTAAERGFSADGPDNALAANGSFLFDYRLLPTIGYRRSYELRDAAERKKRGLKVSSSGEGGATDVEPGGDWVDFDVTLSTDRDQIAVAPGRLERTWIAGGRRWFHYRSEQPMHNVAVFASARYAAATAGNVTVLFDSAHRANVARMLAAATGSLAYFERSFGALPLRELRIAEVPAYWPMGGFATPGLVVLSENRTFLIDARDPARLDLVTRRTAHEVSHQWWGHQVAPADAPGSSMIVESLAKYSELLMLEKQYGRASVRRSLAEELDLYLTGRTGDAQPEVPLARVTSQSYLFYRKGAVVMYALKDLLGEAALNRALHNFVAAEGGPGRGATVDDLLREIGNVTPPEREEVVARAIADWVRDVILYDVRLDAATTRRRTDGRYEVTLQVDARRSRVDANGGESALPLDEAIDVGLFTSDPDDAGPDATLYLAKHALHAGANTIVVVVERPPSFAAIDPYVTRIDRNRFDNVRDVKQPLASRLRF